MLTVQLHFDTKQLQQQIDELLQLASRLPDAARNQALERLKGCGSNIRFGQDVSTTDADGTVHLLRPILLGSDFEDLLSALRTGEADGLV